MTGAYSGQKHVPNFKYPELIIQAVEVVSPEDSVLMGLAPPRMRDAIKGLDKMFMQGTVGNIENIAATVRREFATLKRMMQEDLPCLCTDFQMFITREGRLIHLDVDRCFPRGEEDFATEKRDATRHCIPQLQEFEELIVEKLHRLTVEKKKKK